MFTVADVSEHNPPLDDTFGEQALIMRAAFGQGYQDRQFLHNAAVVKQLWDAGKLDGGCVLYQPYIEPGTAAEHYRFLWSLIGPTVPDWLTGIMIDEESWSGSSWAQRGDKSAALNRLAGMNAHRMGSWKSVKGYANLGDFDALWRGRDPRIDVILAAYTGHLSPGVVAHQVGQQYTDGQAQWGVPRVSGRDLPRVTAPFGPCDHNVFFTVKNAAQFRALWGRPPRNTPPATHKPPVAKPPAPKPAPTPASPFTDYPSPNGQTAIRVYDDGGVTVRRNGQHVLTISKGA